MIASFVRNSMKMRCSIVRDVRTSTNPFGGIGASVEQTIAADVPCRFWEASSTLADEIEIERWKSRMPLGVDVRSKDRVEFVDRGTAYSVEVLTVQEYNHTVVSGRDWV